MWLMCGLNFSLLRLYKHLTCGAYSHTDTSFVSSLMAANLTLRFMESFVSYIVDRTLAYLPGFTALISLAQIGHIETIWQKQQQKKKQYRCICLLSGTGSNLQFSQIWKLSKESGCPPHLMWGTKSMLVSLPFGTTVCLPVLHNQPNASILLTSCRRSQWNWSPMSWSFCPMQASTLRAAGRWRGRRSMLFCCSVLPCRLALWSPTSSKRAGKCNRKPALPVECQDSCLLFCKQHVLSKIISIQQWRRACQSFTHR